jgi:diguanylate cyclase (GGDEF)-like protein
VSSVFSQVDFASLDDYNLQEMKEIYRDDLTGSYNRRYMHHWIDDEIKRAKRFDTKFSLILIDIDDFRRINGEFGLLEGDRVLVRFYEFLRANVREVDSIVRYGGDGFFILMPNSPAAGAIELGRRLLDALSTIEVRGHKIKCSIGFAVYPENGTKADGLIGHADGLLHHAKKEGKNRIGTKQRIIGRLRIPSPVIIGRDDEINWCSTQLKDHDTIFITGPAGIGKTRLAMEIKDRLNTQIIMMGNAYEALSAVAYHPFKNMLGDLLDRDFPLVQQTFKRMADIYQSELVKLLPVSGMLRAAQIEELDKYRLYHAVSDFLGKMAESVYPGVAVIFIDDLQWADRPSIELLDFLMRSMKHNLIIIGTYHTEGNKKVPPSDYLSAWAKEHLCTQIALHPLNEAQTAQLLETIMGEVPPGAVRAIFNMSKGNPFLIEEGLKENLRNNRLHWEDNGWIFSRRKVVAPPSTVGGMITKKIRSLNPEIRGFLEIAAVIGHEFTPQVIAIAGQRNVGQVLEVLDMLCKVGLLKTRPVDNFFFAEDKVRQVVYENIPGEKLRHYHRIVGEAIETVFQNIISSHYEELAGHFAAAREATKALVYSKRAALKARDHYAHGHAVRFYETALKYEVQIEQLFGINFALADIHISMGNYKKALDQLRACIEINPHAYRVYEKQGNVYEKMGQYNRALKYYEKGMNITKGTNAVYIFRAAIAWLYTRMGQYARAKAECAGMLKKRKRMSGHALGDVYVILGIVLLRTGKFNEAEKYFKKSLKIRRSIGDKKNIAACYVDLGLNYQGKFNIKMSEKFFNRALGIYQEVGYQEGILITLNNLGVMYANYDLPKAEAYCLEALSRAKLVGAKRTIVLLYNNLGMISHNRLMSEQALEYFMHSLRTAKEIRFYEGIIFASISLSEFYREKGSVRKGKNYLDAALRIAGEINIKFLSIDCVMEEIEYYLRAGKYKKAQGLVRRMTAQLKTESNVLYRLYNLIYRARVLAALGDNSRVQPLYRQAQSHLRALPANKISGEIFYLRGVAYKREGRFKDALEMFLEADRTFKVVGNLRYLDRIEQEIAGTRRE